MESELRFEGSAEEPRNLVMVSIDSLRADHCGYLGGDSGLTPTLDRFASDGVAYQTAIAPGPQTFSSMPAVFTGRPRPPTDLESYPQNTHWKRRLAALKEHLSRFDTLPERLKAAGYETAGITPNPWTTRAAGFDKGFDRFVDASKPSERTLTESFLERIPGIDSDTRSMELFRNLLSGSEFFAQWEALKEDIAAAREALSEPYFLWVFVLDTHYPFLPTRAHRREGSFFSTYYSALRSNDPMRGKGGSLSPRVQKSLFRSYRDSVRASDAFLEYLESTLAEDDPVFLVHSDHGESLGDHGNYGHNHRQVYEENIHVPYVVANAGVSASVEEPTSLTAIPRTVESIARSGGFDPHKPAGPTAITTSECGANRTLREERYKYLEHEGETELYDLKADPDELNDVSAQLPELRREMAGRLRRRLRGRSEANGIHESVARIATLDAL